MSDLLDRLTEALADRYRIERELGGGGMSRVFLAQETSLGRQVVIKVLPPEMAGQLSVERFKREITLAAQLQHPHIVPLLHTGEVNGLPYFTMPYIRGDSLRTRLADGTLPLNEAMRILREVASAIGFAHAAGVVHRDIKPENVLMAGDTAMVTDFGVARAVSVSTSGGQAPLTSHGMVLGTPAYMSPEQAVGDSAVDRRADIYAWGILAYELLTGATPFADRLPQAMLAAQVTVEPEPLNRRRPGLSPVLSSLVMRCLAKDPGARPQDARELIAALDAVVTQSSEMAARVAAAPRWMLLPHKRFYLVGAVLTLAFAGWAIFGQPRGASPATQRLRSLAVLPFEDPDTSDAYLAEGLTDAIRAQLSDVRELRVMARTSSTQFAGPSVDLPAVGANLGVGAVLQGKARRSNSRIAVTAELVRTSDGVTLWTHSYDQDAMQVAAAEDSIAAAVTGVLGVSLRTTPSAIHHVPSAEAHDLFLRGWFLAQKNSEADLRTAQGYFTQALEKDPNYAEAHAGMSYTWSFLADQYEKPERAYPKAQTEAQRALALDSTLAMSHMALGMALAGAWDPAGSERELRRAAALSPQAADAHVFLANNLCQTGKVAEGLAEIQRSIALDPLSTQASENLTLCLYFAGRYREAIAQHQHTLAIDPNYPDYGDPLLGESYRELGLLDSAIVAYKQAQAKADGRPFYGLAITYARAGRNDDALGVIRQLESRFAKGYQSPTEIALAFASLGKMDSAFTWLRRVVDAHDLLWLIGRSGSEWSAILADPRFGPFERDALPKGGGTPKTP